MQCGYRPKRSRVCTRLFRMINQLYTVQHSTSHNINICRPPVSAKLLWMAHSSQQRQDIYE